MIYFHLYSSIIASINTSIISPNNFIAISTLPNPELVASIINSRYIFPNLLDLLPQLNSVFLTLAKKFPLPTSTGAPHTGHVLKLK